MDASSRRLRFPTGARALLHNAAKRGDVLGGLALSFYLLVAHGAALVGHISRSDSRWCFADDARIWLYSLYRYETPDAFHGDRIVDYMLASMPDGYRLMFRVLGPIVGVGPLSKALPYVLLVIILGAIGAASHRLGGKIAVLGSLSLALGSAYLLGRMAGGLPRAFALPFFACAAACLVYGRIRALGALAVVGVTFYPVIGVTLGCAFALALLLPAGDRGDAAAWSWRKRCAILAAVGAATCSLALPVVLRMRAWGPAISPAMWPDYPEAGPRGRLQGEDLPPFPNVAAAIEHSLHLGVLGAGDPLVRATHVGAANTWILSAVAAVAALLGVLQARRRPEWRRLLVLILTIALTYQLALLSFPLLYVPERYVTYAAVILGLIALPSAGAWHVRKRFPPFTALAFGWCVLLLACFGAAGSKETGMTVGLAPHERKLFRDLEQLPQSVLIAGWPDEVMDDIPYLTHRSVLFTRETHQPWNTKYVELLRARTLSLIAAYSATSRAPLLELRNRYHVTHLLVDRDHFTHPPTYFAPFDRVANAAWAAARGSRWAVLEAIPYAAVLEDRRHVLLDLSKL